MSLSVMYHIRICILSDFMGFFLCLNFVEMTTDGLGRFSANLGFDALSATPPQ